MESRDVAVDRDYANGIGIIGLIHWNEEIFRRAEYISSSVSLGSNQVVYWLAYIACEIGLGLVDDLKD